MTAAVIGFERCSSARSSQAPSHLSIHRGESAQGSTGPRSADVAAMARSSVESDGVLEDPSDSVYLVRGNGPGHGFVESAPSGERGGAGALEERPVALQVGEAQVGGARLANPEELAAVADVEILLGEDEAVVPLDERLEALPGAVGQFVLRARDEQAEGLLRAAADPPAQLVELCEAESVGLLHD